MKAVISLSGGLDSTMGLMYLLAQQHPDGTYLYNEIYAYSFNYGQKHNIELKKLKKNLNFLSQYFNIIHHQVIDLTDVFSGNYSSLVGNNKEIPKGDYNKENMASTVVPIRNVIFSSIIYSKALNIAKETGDSVDIMLGIHGGDHNIYPDCRPESYEACKKAFEVSDEDSDKVNYIAPFIDIPKSGVLTTGIDSMKSLGLDKTSIKKILKNTHSCYDPAPDGSACGQCGTCRERLEAFEHVKMKDPAKYVK